VRAPLAAGAIAIAIVVFAAAPDARQATTDRFRFERPISTSGSGPRRLAVDVPLLAGSNPYLNQDAAHGASRLSDLRLFDESGAPVPYLLLQSPPRRPRWDSATVLPIAATKKTSGFEADFHAARTVEAIRVTGLPAPFLKRLVVEGSGDRQRWTLLSGEATLFDLPDEGIHQTDVPFTAGSYRYVRVTWDDTNSGRLPLPAVVEARQMPAMVVPPSLTVRLPVERRPSEPGRSRYRVKLPTARLPIVALEVMVESGGHVFRHATVSESRLSGTNLQPAKLGSATLSQIVRGGAAARAMRVPIEPPVEAEVDLVIDDGNNAPLEVSGVTAIFDELPWIYFEATGRSVVARYGSPPAPPPIYDLEAVRASVAIESVKDAAWGEPRRIVEREPTSAPTPIPQRGATIGAGPFAFHRAIPDGAPGLAALVLDSAALAHSRGPDAGFADVRILDKSDRQVPYLVERRDEPLTLDLSIERADSTIAELRPAAGRTRSTYLLTLPYPNLPSSRIVLETSARVFQRSVQLGAERQPDRRRRTAWLDVIASAAWVHVDRDDATATLTLPVDHPDATRLWLSVDEGDNSALPITAVRLLLPSYRLRFYQLGSDPLQLVYGRRDLAPPQYDLSLVAPQVMGVEAREVVAAPETGSEARTSPAFISPRAFWVFLAVAVVVLLGLIARLAGPRHS
jgi:hypothetical protein